MNIQIMFDPIEMLRNVDRKVVFDYIRSTITDRERRELGDTVYTADSDTLWEALELKLEEEHKELAIFIVSRVESSGLLRKLDDEDIIDYISQEVGNLMEQIRVSGCMDEVTELFEMKFTG